MQVTSGRMSDNAAPVLILTRPAGERGPALWPGVEAIDSPVLRIADLSPALPPGAFAGLVLTSAHGARGARRLGLALPAYAVGARTAAAAPGPVTIAGPDAAGLIARLVRDGVRGPLLHLRGRHAATDLAARLTASGIPTAELVVYDQIACPLTPAARAALDGTRPVILPVYSPRSAALVAGSGPFAAPLHVVAISDATAAPFAGFSLRTLTVADSPDGAAMQRAVAAAIRRLSPG